jgi:hypothetical protein
MTNDEENSLGINLVPAQLGEVKAGPRSVVVDLNRESEFTVQCYIYFEKKGELRI